MHLTGEEINTLLHQIWKPQCQAGNATANGDSTALSKPLHAPVKRRGDVGVKYFPANVPAPEVQSRAKPG